MCIKYSRNAFSLQQSFLIVRDIAYIISSYLFVQTAVTLFNGCNVFKLQLHSNGIQTHNHLVCKQTLNQPFGQTVYIYVVVE